MTNWTLAQKVGQTLFISFDGTVMTPTLKSIISELHIGGIVLFERNVESPTQLRQLTDDQQAVAQAADSLANAAAGAQSLTAWLRELPAGAQCALPPPMLALRHLVRGSPGGAGNARHHAG